MMGLSSQITRLPQQAFNLDLKTLIYFTLREAVARNLPNLLAMSYPGSLA